jgi:cytochrome c-type biogenesis protein CcmH
VLSILGKAGFARLFAAALTVAALAAAVALTIYFRAAYDVPDDKLRMQSASADDGNGPAVMVQRLIEHVEKQPRDARAWAILARLHLEADRFPEAARAYGKALALPSKVANDPAVWCEYADALGMTQGGDLSGKPRELIGRALAISPHHPKALEMAGSAAYEQGDYAGALGYWQSLLAALDPGSQRHNELSAAIARAERRTRVTLPVPRQQ